jgi:hypothetical protein
VINIEGNLFGCCFEFPGFHGLAVQLNYFFSTKV